MMKIKEKLESILNEDILNFSSISGGCIGDSQIVLTKSNKYFLKTYPNNRSKLLQCEANGLAEINKTNSIKTPKVIDVNNDFLLLEFVEEGRKNSQTMSDFGIELAIMHKHTSESFGFYEDNFIGANIQKNINLKNNWVEFYWEERLVFQYKLAEKNGYTDSDFRSRFNKLSKNINSILNDSIENPSLIHGDLWSGNYLVDNNSKVVLIDPAVYYGHREAELGMTLLFGGFSSDFYNAYDEEFPLEKNWKYRIDLYKLYHLMNHLNLFGNSYYSQVQSAINKYI